MSDARDLNFEVIDQLMDSGYDPKSLLEDLIKALDAYTVNDHLAFIVRVSDLDNALDPDTLKDLETYERD
jgi:hypothetical protein